MKEVSSLHFPFLWSMSLLEKDMQTQTHAARKEVMGKRKDGHLAAKERGWSRASLHTSSEGANPNNT